MKSNVHGIKIAKAEKSTDKGRLVADLSLFDLFFLFST